MENLRKIIAERLDVLGLGPVEAATKVGLEKGYIRDFLEGRKQSFRNDKLAQLADALEIDISALVAATAKKKPITVIQEPANAKILGPITIDSTKMIPIYGQAVAGVHGEFVLNGNVLYEVICPPQLYGVENAYGVVVSGNSMSPRYEDGEIVYVNPHRRVKQGDYVVAQVQLDEGAMPHAFVKRFVRHNAEELVLFQFNPQKEMRFNHKNVASVHFIVASGEL